MKYEGSPVSIRSFAPQLIESGGPSPSNQDVPPMIGKAIRYLPFRIKDIIPIASTGEREDRQVVVFSTSLEDGQTVVVKIGRTYDTLQHGEPQDRASLELESTRIFQESTLSPYVIPSFSLLAGEKADELYDIRVQRAYAKGVQLADLDLRELNPGHIDTLIQYHKALLMTVINRELYPETGIAIQTETSIKNLLSRFLRLVPLTSENVLFDIDSHTLSIVDTGHPYNFSNHNKRIKQQVKKMFTASLILGEIGLLYAFKGYKTVMSEKSKMTQGV